MYMYLRHTKRSNFDMLLTVTKLKAKLQLVKKRSAAKIILLTSRGLDFSLA